MTLSISNENKAKEHKTQSKEAIIHHIAKKSKDNKFLLNIQKDSTKHTTVGIRWWSPTQLLIHRSTVYVWQSGRDAQFSVVYGRMYRSGIEIGIIKGLVAEGGGEGW